MLPSSSRLPPLSSLGGFFADPVSSAVSLLLLVVVQVPTPCPQPCPGGPWWHLCSADPPQLLWPSGLTHTFPKRSRWLMSALRRRNRICLSRGQAAPIFVWVIPSHCRTVPCSHLHPSLGTPATPAPVQYKFKLLSIQEKPNQQGNWFLQKKTMWWISLPQITDLWLLGCLRCPQSPLAAPMDVTREKQRPLVEGTRGCELTT